MAFNRFRTLLMVRILGLLSSALLLAFLLVRTEYYLTASLVILLLVYQTWNLMEFLEESNRRLRRFLESIEYEDFSQSFTIRHQGPAFRELNQYFAEVMGAFQKTRAEKEENFRYLQTVVQHINTGVLSFDQRGEVELMNQAAKKLLSQTALKNIAALRETHPVLYGALSGLQAGEDTLITVHAESEELLLTLRATEFRMRGNLYKLVSMQNIRTEIQEKELEAWRTLTRVLTHEIMNSITPISSLSATTVDLIEDKLRSLPERAPAGGDTETLTDIQQALNTIRRRSESLTRFVAAYRQFSRLPEPQLRQFSVRELLGRLYRLVEPEARAQRTSLQVTVIPGELTLQADPELVEQALINLIKNALDALQGQAGSRVEIRSKPDSQGRVVIQVTDNGPGIPASDLEKVFVPFYTTKPSGSGIGLSLVRQVMHSHRGSVAVQSQAGETVFKLTF